jgi:hypothetical protein
LDCENAQVLLIYEGLGVLGKAVEDMSKEKPKEELEKLEEEVSRWAPINGWILEQTIVENRERIEHLKEDDPLLFADRAQRSIPGPNRLGK